jgi:hypothetical protein
MGWAAHGVNGGERLGHNSGPPYAFPFPLIRSS